MNKPWLIFALPTLLVMVLAVLPLILGDETLFLRDTFNVHLAMKVEQGRALASGELPWIAPGTAGGQPLLGNLNAVALYPDNLLYLVAPLFWAFNAHFWLHLLLAPLAAWWLGRAWGLSPPGAWACGVAYGTSGWMISQLNFYNLAAGVALTPALIAALLTLSRLAGSERAADTERDGAEDSGFGDRRPWKLRRVGGALLAAVLLWWLLLLAGDPLIAVLALVLATAALVLRDGRALWNRRRAGLLMLAVVGGTALAAPQLVEFVRILPLSYRGYAGFSGIDRLIGSFDPRQLIDQVLPFAFGRPDQLRFGSFWGYPYYQGHPPIFLTLYPGLAVVTLALAGGWGRWRRGEHRRARLWAGCLFAGGAFFALGAFNPVAKLLLELPVLGFLRYPTKLWLAVALGLALLAGLGFERIFAGGPEAARRGWRKLVLAAAAAYGLLGAGLYFLPIEGVFRNWIPDSFPEALADYERLRWSGLALLTAGLAAVFWALGKAAEGEGRRPYLGAVVLVLHTASQLVLLRPAMPMDEVTAYQEPSPLLAKIPADARVVHGADEELFGPVHLMGGTYPQPEVRWIHRRAVEEAYPPAGIFHGRRFELNLSPEGLGSYLTRLGRDAVKGMDDARRLRLLSAWGVSHLIVPRPLDPEAVAELEAEGVEVELLERRPSYGGEIRLYALPARPSVSFATQLRFAPDVGAAFDELMASGFDGTSSVVLAGEGASVDRPAGRVVAFEERPSGLWAEVSSPQGGFLVWQRSYLPLYRTTIDGEPSRAVVANLHRLGVEVPAGTHRVEIAVDGRPFYLALAVAAVALLILVAISLRLGRPGGRLERRTGSPRAG